MVISTSRILFLSLGIVLKLKNKFFILLFVKTDDVIYNGNRTDVHVVFSLMFARVKSSIMCRFRGSVRRLVSLLWQINSSI